MFRNKWFRFALVALLYIAWVIWLNSYWWLLGLLVIFDMYITKKVRWTFWKPKDPKKRNVWLEWLDALIFALIAATFVKMFFFEAYLIPSSSMENSLMTGDYLFVSKLKFGPKVPQTPLTIPLTHNTFLGKESYTTLIRNKYRRMKGYGQIERFKPVVFNFPHGDTVMSKAPAADYYEQVRLQGRAYTERVYGPLIVRPADKKDHYVKRCVALPGDTLQVIDGVVHINGVPEPWNPGLQMSYTVVTDGKRINDKMLDKLGISLRETAYDSRLPGYPYISMGADAVPILKALPNVVSVEAHLDVWPPDYPDSYMTLFPHSQLSAFNWTRDNYGPIWMPRKGDRVPLTEVNLVLYSRLIRDYEHHSLELREGKAWIDGKETDSYTFGQDYFFMMGDNRHNSLDSRYWGFVPEDHIVGAPSLVWFSSDKAKPFPKNIRWKRLFKTNFN